MILYTSENIYDKIKKSSQSKPMIKQHYLPSLTYVEDDIGAYLRDIQKIPLLDVSEERELAMNFHQNGDLKAAKKLVIANLRFVVYIAQRYAAYGFSLLDLVQEGSIGLMKAIKRFDPQKKIRLISFAVHWIKAEIQEFILKNRRLINMTTTKLKRKLFFKINKAYKSADSDKEIEAISQDMNVESRLVDEMQINLKQEDTNLDFDQESAVYQHSSNLENPEEMTQQQDEMEWQSKKLSHALYTLDERSRDILICRRLKEKKDTLSALSKKYNISIERVRQLEQMALIKLKPLV